MAGPASLCVSKITVSWDTPPISQEHLRTVTGLVSRWRDQTLAAAAAPAGRRPAAPAPSGAGASAEAVRDCYWLYSRLDADAVYGRGAAAAAAPAAGALTLEPAAAGQCSARALALDLPAFKRLLEDSGICGRRRRRRAGDGGGGAGGEGANEGWVLEGARGEGWCWSVRKRHPIAPGPVAHLHAMRATRGAMRAMRGDVPFLQPPLHPLLHFVQPPPLNSGCLWRTACAFSEAWRTGPSPPGPPARRVAARQLLGAAALPAAGTSPSHRPPRPSGRGSGSPRLPAA